MTLHASKGLEFPVVYLTAVEEGLLPHERSREHPEQLEEERRLMFVGITRAQQELQLSLARYRDFRGQRKTTIPSSFLMELPRGEMDLKYGGNGADFARYDIGEWEHDAAGTEDVFADGHLQVESHQVGANYAASSTATTSSERMVSPAARLAPAFQLTTAAELAGGGDAAPPADPDAFRQGMVVRHPTLGLGRVVALSGSGAARKATVDFASSAGRKRFILSKSPLRPVKAE